MPHATEALFPEGFALVVPAAEPGGSFGCRVGQDGYWFARQDDGSFLAQHLGPGGAFSPGRCYRVTLGPAGCSCKGFRFRGRCKHLNAVLSQATTHQAAG